MAIIPAIRIWRRIRATLSSTSSSGLLRTATQRVVPATSTGIADVPTRSPATVSMPDAIRSSSTAVSAAG
jgi:hypothetical protein